MNRQAGRPRKENPTPVVSDLDGQRTNEILGNEVGESREQVRRYIRLTNLVSELLELVDEGKQMAVMELMMPPTMREQQTIGGFFQQLDHLITLHQRELEQLQSIKKALLEKMFV